MSDIPVKHHVSQDFLLNQLMNALVHPLAADPGAPTNFQIWGNSTENRIKLKVPAGVESVAWVSDVTAGGLTSGLFDANTLLKADVDNTPLALTVDASGIVGRTAGGSIASLTAAEVITILGLPAGTVANQAYVDAAIAALVDSAPAAIDTLNELAAALGDDPNFATTVNTALSQRNQGFSVLIGDGVLTTFAITHGFTREVTAEVYEEATGLKVVTSQSLGGPGSTTYTLNFATAPANNEFRLIVSGTP